MAESPVSVSTHDKRAVAAARSSRFHRERALARLRRVSASVLPLRAASMRIRRLACSTLLVALVLAQTLGLIHRIVHAPIGGHPAVTASASSGIAWMKALFAGHSSEQGCHLYDQLSHADAVPQAPSAALVVHDIDAVPSWYSGVQVAAQAAGFLARGPPSAG